MMDKQNKTGTFTVPSKLTIVSLTPPAVRSSRAADRVERMEWTPYPTSYYIRAEQRRYYGASNEVQHMMWEPYPAAYFTRARWHRFNKPKNQGMTGGSLPSRKLQPAAASKNTAGNVQNHFATHNRTSGATDQVEKMDWQS